MAAPTLRQLEYLVALADERHFGAAADRCGVSQPNLSAQVRELERNLGVQLVERSPRSVIVTRTGIEIVERARRVLRNVDDLVDVARSDGDPFSGSLRMGVIPTVAPYVLPRVLPAVRRTYPNLELHLIEDFTDRLVPRLRAGELDVVFMALPATGGGLHGEVIAEEPFVVLAPAGHRMARSASVSRKTFDASDLLLLQEGHCLRDQALDLCDAQPDRQSPVEGSSLSTLVQMVANGLGTTLLPLIAVTVDLPKNEEVRALPFRNPQPGRTLGLVWRDSAGRAAAYEELSALLRSEVATLLDDAKVSLRARNADLHAH